MTSRQNLTITIKRPLAFNWGKLQTKLDDTIKQNVSFKQQIVSDTNEITRLKGKLQGQIRLTWDLIKEKGELDKENVDLKAEIKRQQNVIIKHETDNYWLETQKNKEISSLKAKLANQLEINKELLKLNDRINKVLKEQSWEGKGRDQKTIQKLTEAYNKQQTQIVKQDEVVKDATKVIDELVSKVNYLEMIKRQLILENNQETSKVRVLIDENNSMVDLINRMENEHQAELEMTSRQIRKEKDDHYSPILDELYDTINENLRKHKQTVISLSARPQAVEKGTQTELSAEQVTKMEADVKRLDKAVFDLERELWNETQRLLSLLRRERDISDQMSDLTEMEKGFMNNVFRVAKVGGSDWKGNLENNLQRLSDYIKTIDPSFNWNGLDTSIYDWFSKASYAREFRNLQTVYQEITKCWYQLSRKILTPYTDQRKEVKQLRRALNLETRTKYQLQKELETLQGRIEVIDSWFLGYSDELVENWDNNRLEAFKDSINEDYQQIFPYTSDLLKKFVSSNIKYLEFYDFRPTFKNLVNAVRKLGGKVPKENWESEEGIKNWAVTLSDEIITKTFYWGLKWHTVY